MKKMKPKAMRRLPWKQQTTRLQRRRNLRNPSNSDSFDLIYHPIHLIVTCDDITGPAFWYSILWLDAAVTESWQRYATICKLSTRLKRESNPLMSTSLACSPRRRCLDLVSKYLSRIITLTAGFMSYNTRNLLWRLNDTFYWSLSVLVLSLVQLRTLFIAKIDALLVCGLLVLLYLFLPSFVLTLDWFCHEKLYWI